MDLVVVDDSKQNKPTRKGMGRLVAVGGLYVPSGVVRVLEAELDALCADHGFPEGEEFKWSPSRKSWMHDHLQAEARERFFQAALHTARGHGVTAIVVLEDATRGTAVPGCRTAEDDVVAMFLERADNVARDLRTLAIVVADRPSGGRKQEAEFLSECLRRMRNGTRFASLEHLSLLVATDSRLSRLVQLADVVTGSIVSLFAGEEKWARRLYGSVKPLLRQERDRIGGIGVKIQPDYRYANLYYWLLGDTHLLKGNVGSPLPLSGRSYAASPDAP